MLESTDVMRNWNNQVSLFRFRRVIFALAYVKGNASVTEYSFYGPYIAIICSTPNVLLVKQFHIFEAVIHETNETVNINSLKLRLYFDHERDMIYFLGMKKVYEREQCFSENDHFTRYIVA